MCKGYSRQITGCKETSLVAFLCVVAPLFLVLLHGVVQSLAVGVPVGNVGVGMWDDSFVEMCV